MNAAFIFPGQGSQSPGMLHRLLDHPAVVRKEMVAHDLVNNIAHGVRWHDATTVLKELGCGLFLEMPPGHTLSDLAKENLPGINSVPVEASVLARVLRLIQMQNAHDDVAQLIRMEKVQPVQKT
jgi:malonyl CoA-acyl carrier protein transacylase